jgi:hypothetical protein
VHPQCDLRLLPIPAEASLPDQYAHDQSPLDIAQRRLRPIGHEAYCFTVMKNVKRIGVGASCFTVMKNVKRS